MKKKIILVNAILLALIMIFTGLYLGLNGNVSKYALAIFKSVASILFVVVNAIDGYYGLKIIKNKKPDLFPIILFIALVLSCIADIIIMINFIFGAIIFALGHVFFFISFIFLKKLNIRDIVCILTIICMSVLLLTLLPNLDFKGLDAVIYAYAVIISFMLGKAISNMIGDRSNIKNIIIMVGAVLFYFSDLMLVLRNFGPKDIVFSFLCLFTYYPAQFMLASSVILYYLEKVNISDINKA